jgi:hypothetical protein
MTLHHPNEKILKTYLQLHSTCAKVQFPTTGETDEHDITDEGKNAVPAEPPSAKAVGEICEASG